MVMASILPLAHGAKSGIPPATPTARLHQAPACLPYLHLAPCYPLYRPGALRRAFALAVPTCL